MNIIHSEHLEETNKYKINILLILNINHLLEVMMNIHVHLQYIHRFLIIPKQYR